MSRLASPSRPRGFSAIELLMVLLVLGIVAAAVIPHLQPSVTEQLLSTARIVTAELNYARELAVANNSRYTATFDLNRRRFTLEHSGADSALDELPVNPLDPDADPTQRVLALEELPRVGPPPRFVALAEAESGDALTDVEFGSYGQLLSGEATALVLGCGTGGEARFLTITIDPHLGQTRVSPVRSSP